MTVLAAGLLTAGATMLAAAPARATTYPGEHNVTKSKVTNSCYAESFPCGADYCYQREKTCCASVGRPDLYCQPGDICQPDGTCLVGSTSSSSGSTSSSSSSTSSGGTSGSSGTSSGSSGSATEQCSTLPELGLCDTVESCCEGNGASASCWYRADGHQIDCYGRCGEENARELEDFCGVKKSSSGSTSSSSSGSNASDSNGSSSCAASPAATSGSSSPWLLALVIPVVGAALRSRRRRARTI